MTYTLYVTHTWRQPQAHEAHEHSLAASVHAALQTCMRQFSCVSWYYWSCPDSPLLPRISHCAPCNWAELILTLSGSTHCCLRRAILTPGASWLTPIHACPPALQLTSAHADSLRAFACCSWRCACAAEPALMSCICSTHSRACRAGEPHQIGEVK